MRNEYKTKMEEIFSIDDNFSGVVVYRRRVFEDPVLTVYYLRGEPVYAESFLIKRRWWEGLLSDEEAENHLFDDAFGYASERYGNRYVEHIKEYARETITLTAETVRDFGWELEAEPTEYLPEEVASMFHIPYGRNETVQEVRERDLTSELNALGFPVFYVSGSRGDPHGFFHTIRPVKRVMDRVTRVVEGLQGSLAFVLPLYIVARFDLEEGRAWVVTKDVRRLMFALRYLDPVKGIPENVLNEMAQIRCCRYVIWRSSEDTFSVFDGSELRTLNAEEVTETVDGYLNEYDRILSMALSRIPSNVPPKMGKMLLHQMLSRNPRIGEFLEDFSSRFGINLDHEQGES